MNPDLLNWLDNNKMCFNIIDEDVIEITGFGKMYYEDTSMIKSIFRTCLLYTSPSPRDTR